MKDRLDMSQQRLGKRLEIFRLPMEGQVHLEPVLHYIPEQMLVALGEIIPMVEGKSIADLSPNERVVVGTIMEMGNNYMVDALSLDIRPDSHWTEELRTIVLSHRRKNSVKPLEQIVTEDRKQRRTLLARIWDLFPHSQSVTA